MIDLSLREAPLTFETSLQKGEAERAHDTLKLLPYAEALRDFILGCETPMSIGIQGEWGVGKTTLMNMLRGSEAVEDSGLLRGKHCAVVNFETWSYAQFNEKHNLALACLHALTGKIGEVITAAGELPDYEISESVREAREILEHVFRQAHTEVPKGPYRLRGSDGSLDTPLHHDLAADMLRFRGQFEALLRLWAGADERRRLVIFIDDLDRIRPTEVVVLLEAIKNFIDVPSLVFVLAVDYEVVQQGVAEWLGPEQQRTSGKAFYDKIIQLPFVVPSASYELDEYILRLLVKSAFPFGEELQQDEDSARYFVDVTLCTVGKNPRNIKRVMNYANLLERIRRHEGSEPSDAREAKILYAMICMQVAWPELYDHFIADPTVDTVTSLENWAYLERLPEARALFERSPDREKVKNNVSTFFDTLFSLLDENDDGQIDTRELEPVMEVMSRARMTAAGGHERPRDYIVRRVRENNAGQSALVDTFLENVFMKSVWYLGSECRYRKSGRRYVTMVYDGRQIGSMVSLRHQPLIFRLAMPPEEIASGLKAFWNSKRSVSSEAITMTRAMFDKEASLTGFGDTLVDYSKMTNLPAKDAIGLMNALFRIVTGQSRPESEGRKDKKGG
ncbi:MAG: hypothetical protein GTN86_02195 [Xanthomonadales bacterium]|nr:hypothetical protein [Xanthomonadales bacterium]NIN58824.1 hypothetical protein [Xanthomonadales bacterium]NIN74092.1 hypothetical protein [Xanthomonadales bacterium]NIO14625.1 hypothetical protein [Xanthomonadales bacterium]NIP11217.1 hypothetical protein [Xanthomonadales bacterium]